MGGKWKPGQKARGWKPRKFRKPGAPGFRKEHEPRFVDEEMPPCD